MEERIQEALGLAALRRKTQQQQGPESTGSGSNKAQIFRKPGQSSKTWGDSSGPLPSGLEEGMGKPPQPYHGLHDLRVS